jgi:hypothetical protein
MRPSNWCCRLLKIIDLKADMIKALLIIMAGLFSLLKIGSKIGDGVIESHHASLRSVVKNNDVLKYCISNEFICAEIGRFIGLPIPPCGIVYAQGYATKHWFASLNFNLTADDLPPIDPQKCAEELPDLSTGLILFDILIANPDRHRKNLSIDFDEKPPRMSIFDHSHALFGHVNGAGVQRLNDLHDRLGISGGTVTGQNRHCLIDKLNTDNFFHKWCGRIISVPNHLIEDACDGTFDLDMITAEEASAAKEFLIHRRNNIRVLVDSHHGEFTGINQWSFSV